MMVVDSMMMTGMKMMTGMEMMADRMGKVMWRKVHVILSQTQIAAKVLMMTIKEKVVGKAVLSRVKRIPVVFPTVQA